MAIHPFARTKDFNWLCPFCNRHTTVTENHRQVEVFDVEIQHAGAPAALAINLISCANVECRELYIEAGLSRSISRNRPLFRDVENSWTLRPQGVSRLFPEYVPQAVRDDYREACDIRELSPKASATLSRRCLQGMIRDVFDVKNKNTLFQEIEAIRERVDAESWAAIDAVRKLGNIGAHMDRDRDVIVDVDPTEAALLIALIETLITQWYVNREESRRRIALIVEAANGKKAPKILQDGREPMPTESTETEEALDEEKDVDARPASSTFEE